MLWPAPFGLETLDGGLDRRLDADVAGGANAHKQCAGLGIERQGAVAVASPKTKHTFVGQQRLAVEVGRGLALVGGNLGFFLVLTMPGPHVAQRVGDFPDAVLVGHQDLTVAPSQPVRLVEALRMPLDELGLTVGVEAQECQMAGLLLGDDNIAVGQHEQAARMLELGNQGGRKALGEFGDLTFEGQAEGTVGNRLRGAWGGQIVGAHAEGLARLLIAGDEFLGLGRHPLPLGFLLGEGRRYQQGCKHNAHYHHGHFHVNRLLNRKVSRQAMSTSPKRQGQAARPRSLSTKNVCWLSRFLSSPKARPGRR